MSPPPSAAKERRETRDQQIETLFRNGLILAEVARQVEVNPKTARHVLETRLEREEILRINRWRQDRDKAAESAIQRIVPDEATLAEVRAARNEAATAPLYKPRII